MLNGTDASNLRKIAIKILSQTASTSKCERNGTHLISSIQKDDKLKTQRLNDFVFVHYNMRLRMKHTREREDKNHSDPIDLTYIYNEDEDKNPAL